MKEVLRMIKSPIGILLAAAGVILVTSPDARNAVRKLAVKGTEWVLDLNSSLRPEARNEPLTNIGSASEESRAINVDILEKEQPHIAH